MPDLSVLSRSGDNAFVSGARVLLGLFVLVTGIVTFFVPEIRGAFNGQLSAAGIPLHRLTLFVLPTVEGVAGVMLMTGVLPRVASMATILIMGLFTYLHLVVQNPVVFPLQFGLPLIPIVALVLACFLYLVQDEPEEEEF